jgi:diguanylate cyclase (GGDEF)-like protein
MKKADFLKSVPIFSLMSDLELQAVADFLEVRTYPKGSIIFAEGQTGSDLFIVYTGEVGSWMAGTDGSRRETDTFGPFRFFGEMALVEGTPRSNTCYALTDVRVLVLSGLHFYRIVWDYPMLAVKLLKMMTKVMIERLSKASVFLDDIVRWGEIARRRAVTDDLSGLFNRRFLEETVSSRFSRGISLERPCSLLMIDFDRFRDINLKYGAIAGDAVITNAGATMLRLMSASCIPSRLSGDEFAIFLPGAGIEEAESLAGILRTEIADLFLEFRTGHESKPERVILTLSIGAVSCPLHAKTETELFEAADRALYRAKQEGRNRVCRGTLCQP